MPRSNRKQCYVIEGAEVLDNPNGTAPGLWLVAGRRRIALLPGPPREIRPMFEDHVLPRLAGLGRGPVLRRVLRLTGLGESAMETRIGPFYAAVPPDVSVTTLASPGELSIRLSTVPARDPRAAAEARTGKAHSGRRSRPRALHLFAGRGDASRRSSAPCSRPKA